MSLDSVIEETNVNDSSNGPLNQNYLSEKSMSSLTSNENGGFKNFPNPSTGGSTLSSQSG